MFVDPHDVYAAAVNSVTIKTFFGLVAVQDLECLQFDFKTAFLNAKIPDDKGGGGEESTVL
jgi:hypothetical protein